MQNEESLELLEDFIGSRFSLKAINESAEKACSPNYSVQSRGAAKGLLIELELTIFMAESRIPNFIALNKGTVATKKHLKTLRSGRSRVLI